MTCLHVVRIEVEVHGAGYIIVDSDKAKKIFCVGIIRMRRPSSKKGNGTLWNSGFFRLYTAATMSALCAELELAVSP